MVTEVNEAIRCKKNKKKKNSTLGIINFIHEGKLRMTWTENKGNHSGLKDKGGLL